MTYYNHNAKRFIDNTLNIDMSDLYSRFTKNLPDSGIVLDIGCGSGRDLKYFKNNGFEVLGLEPSEELATFAREYSNCEVLETLIENFETSRVFDGIWACASLLHLENSALIDSLKKISSMMSDKSIFYCSFKLGDFKGIRNGRFFNDQTLDSFSELMPQELKVQEHWITKDLRPERNEEWLNLLMKLT
jgi:SAM-dependent methyltransferase